MQLAAVVLNRYGGSRGRAPYGEAENAENELEPEAPADDGARPESARRGRAIGIGAGSS